MLLILASGAAALAVATPIHSAEITHASNAYRASYETESTVRFREVESRFANRPSMPVCRWQAELVVNRDVATQGRTLAAVAKPIHRFAPLSGSHAGGCTAARDEIEAEVARHASARAAEAVAVAQRDRSVLLGELDGIHALSAKDAVTGG
ncbi:MULTISPECIES: hypothetical protein [Sphingobium]|jgi:hypothetical protein|uniref:UrcA family protein n=1 Tax=Sphingobium fuliginis (strain ATCC 27551) TaxID=336203 RepID=A0A4Q4J0Q5_SPHSA|nr:MULTISPECIES: hypothetical protein [Sphingobium]AJR24711.1 hypothetical protein TZ53_14240 [Sphingobium sp. YBL2]QOT71805.1 hypothetical protein H5V43_01085 [Sphingobium fuliginis]RYL99377.1 hypothetical protein EWH10_05710 [Sphingobium fuliginis]WDA36802.1 hypothetical protein PO876_00870 [Sphingobium sp. YC-XJ3]GFZ84406.1 hypothetical protein GCM10019071_11400 [Sphingobium fuliginis]